MKKGKFLLEKDITAPSILVLITTEERWKRKLIFVTRKFQGGITGAHAILAIGVDEIERKPRLLLQDPSFELGERLYIPNGKGGHHKGISRFEAPTEEELRICKKIFENAKKDLQNPVIKIKLPSFEMEAA